MKITDIKITPVTVPMDATLRWCMGTEDGTTRGVVQVFTDEGITGIGETYGGNAVEHAIEIAKPLLIGLDPLETGVIMHRLNVFCISYESAVPAVVRAGIEMACLDAAGKALKKPVHALLGGKTRDRIEMVAYVFYKYASADRSMAPIDSPKDILEHTKSLVKKHGFRTIKLKGGVHAPHTELKALELLRENFPDAPLRWDPNGAWSVETSIRTLRRLQKSGVELEYMEDPTWNLEGNSQVRQAIHDIPIATNMCLIAWDQLAPGIRMRAVDIVLSDVHYWGGFRQNQKMMAVCEAFQLGVGMHSDRELGISTAAMLHLAAASPYLSYAIDSHYHDQLDDIITKPFVYKEGCFDVPNGPGLGVEVNWDKVARYHELYKKGGQTNEFFDPRRPKWVPALPIF